MIEMVKPQSVRAQLARLHAAESFNSSPQLVSFLDFVVEETLAGREKGIKGYTIAVEALGRPQDFDPQSDPIVRVEARRLRQALRSYYSGPGADDEIVIAMPTGGYVPTFSIATPGAQDAAVDDESDNEPPTGDETPAAAPKAAMEPHPAAIQGPIATPSFAARPPPRPISRGRITWGAAAAVLLALAGSLLVRETLYRANNPRGVAADRSASIAATQLPAIRVEAFDVTGGDDQSKTIALHIAERFAAAFSLFDEIRVIGPSAPPPASDGDYLMRGRLTRQPNGGYALTIAVLAPQDREVLLARDYPSFQPEEAQPIVSDAAPQDQVVRSLTIEIAQPLGFIGADQMRRLATASPDKRCLYMAQIYWRSPTPEKHAEARACLKGGGAAFIPPFLVEAHLSFLALDEFRNDYGAKPGAPPLDRALSHARAAIEASPSSARAQQAMMDALFTRGQTDEALRAGARALTLNPLDMDVVADYGARLVQAGRVSEGRAKLLEAAEAMPVRPPWHDFHLVLSAMLLDEPAAGIAHAKLLVSESDPLSLIAQILAARAQGATDRQEALGRKLVALDARYRTEPRALLARRMFAPPVLDFLVTAVAEATRGDRSDSRAQQPARAG